MKLLNTILVALALVSVTDAQRLAAEFQSSFLPSGTIQLRVHDTTGNGFLLTSPCGDVDILFDGPNGFPIPNPPSCGPGTTTIPPFGTFTYSWPPFDPNGNVWPGAEYWFRFRAVDPVTMLPFDEVFSYRHQYNGPTNYIAGTPSVGVTSQFNVNGGPANGFYWTFLSRTSNQALIYQGLQWSLSFDGLLNASLTNPLSVMSNSFGALDSNGSATGDLIIPPLPSLAYSGFVMQTLLIDIAGTGAYESTNALYRRILP